MTDILDSNNRRDSDPEFAKCVSKIEAGNRRLKKDTGSGCEEEGENVDSSSDSNTNGGLEVGNGVLQRWSVGEEDMLEEFEESTTAEEYFGTGAMSSGDSSSISIVEEILHDVLHTVVSQCSDTANVSSLKMLYLKSSLLKWSINFIIYNFKIFEEFGKYSVLIIRYRIVTVLIRDDMPLEQ